MSESLYEKYNWDFSNFSLLPLDWTEIYFNTPENHKTVLWFLILADNLPVTLHLQNSFFIFSLHTGSMGINRNKMGKAPNTNPCKRESVTFREFIDSDSIYHKFLNRMIFFDGTSGNIIKTPSPK